MAINKTGFEQAEAIGMDEAVRYYGIMHSYSHTQIIESARLLADHWRQENNPRKNYFADGFLNSAYIIARTR